MEFMVELFPGGHQPCGDLALGQRPRPDYKDQEEKFGEGKKKDKRCVEFQGKPQSAGRRLRRLLFSRSFSLPSLVDNVGSDVRKHLERKTGRSEADRKAHLNTRWLVVKTTTTKTILGALQSLY